MTDRVGELDICAALNRNASKEELIELCNQAPTRSLPASIALKALKAVGRTATQAEFGEVYRRLVDDDPFNMLLGVGGPTFGERLVKFAFEEGLLPLLNYLHHRVSHQIDSAANIRPAIQSGNPDVLGWLVENSQVARECLGTQFTAWAWVAIEHGHLDVLKRLVGLSGVDATKHAEFITTVAASYGHLDILRWGIAELCPTREEVARALRNAITYGNLTLSRSIQEEYNFSFLDLYEGEDDFAVISALTTDVDHASWLTENFEITDEVARTREPGESSMFVAFRSFISGIHHSKSSRLDIIRWFLTTFHITPEEFDASSGRDILKAAVAKGDSALVNWLVEHFNLEDE